MKCLKCEIVWSDPNKKYQSNSCPFCQAELPKNKEVRASYIAKGFDIENGVLLRYIGDGGVVQLPDCIEVVGYGAFAYCRALTEVVLPSSVTTIDDWTFYECNNLTNVSLPSSIAKIGNSSFLRCVNLNKIVIPTTVTTIGLKAFTHCQSLPSETADLVRKINSSAI